MPRSSSESASVRAWLVATIESRNKQIAIHLDLVQLLI